MEHFYAATPASAASERSIEKYTRSEILAARQKWIDFLLIKGRRKATGILDEGDGHRCCLGHACYVLGLPRKPRESRGFSYDNGESELAPPMLIESLGLWDAEGGTQSIEHKITLARFEDSLHDSYPTLAQINDETDASPRQIGEYLATVIEGGDHTPFRPLSDYRE